MMPRADVMTGMLSGAGALGEVTTGHAIVGAALAALGVFVSVMVWDIRRKQGIAEWLKSFMPAVEAWSKFFDRRAKRRDERLMAELRARQERKDFRERHRRGLPGWLRRSG